MNACTTAIFPDARPFTAWQECPVPDELLEEIYELARLGPTSSNCCQTRVVFIRTTEAKPRLAACLDEGDVEKAMKAPVTAIVRITS